mgnify:CR=1 FL=1
MSVKLHIKKGDMVYVIAGDSRGQQGKVLAVDPEKQRAIVEGVNMCKRLPSISLTCRFSTPRAASPLA